MINYNNSSIVQSLRQYEMFANSLNLVKTKEEHDMIVKQLTKLEIKIIELTNEVYEEEYSTLVNKECGLLDEEKRRLTMLIDLINQRLSYVEKRCNDHYKLTGNSIDIQDVLGADTLDELEERIKIIDKYNKNKKLEKELQEETESLTNKISLASKKIEINKKVNQELEEKFKETISNALEKLGLYSLLETKEEIEYSYYETEKSLTLAELNLETAKTHPMNILNDCEKMLTDIREDYLKYKDKINIIKLIETYNEEVTTYEELLRKRSQINDLFKSIRNEQLINMTAETIKTQYNTILMEQQDINTFNDLTQEKSRKTEALSEIEEENNSEEFQNVLKVLIENEKRKQAKIEEEQKKIEEEERKRKLEIERKRQEEILKRQKIIEEARKKEIEKRTKELLREQQKSVLQAKKTDEKSNVSFETIKDITNNYSDEEEASLERRDVNSKEEDKKNFLNQIAKNSDFTNDINKQENSEKTRVDIEKELFAEFNDKKEKPVDNKLPDVSLDEYMKNFDEKEINMKENIFDDNMFPSIPV